MPSAQGVFEKLFTRATLELIVAKTRGVKAAAAPPPPEGGSNGTETTTQSAAAGDAPPAPPPKRKERRGSITGLGKTILSGAQSKDSSKDGAKESGGPKEGGKEGGSGKEAREKETAPSSSGGGGGGAPGSRWRHVSAEFLKKAAQGAHAPASHSSPKTMPSHPMAEPIDRAHSSSAVHFAPGDASGHAPAKFGLPGRFSRRTSTSETAKRKSHGDGRESDMSVATQLPGAADGSTSTAHPEEEAQSMTAKLQSFWHEKTAGGASKPDARNSARRRWRDAYSSVLAFQLPS